ncbi:MAG TPA: SelB C-terminal domain-containing protein, partial [Bacillota bacterium]|nr:SelB C-terminal domain-containing protein [Bacillota bacterium]
QEVALAEERKATGPFRLPVDRCFSVTGFGTIVTGTLSAGEIRVGDSATVLPSGLDTKIRSLQVHGEKVDQATAGQRVAVNLAGLEVAQIHRGDMVATPDLLQPSYRLDVEFNLLASAEKKIENRQRMRLHLGTTEALCRIVLLDREELEPGETVLAQLLVEQPVVAAKHDRFVLRTYSPMHTVGGGVIIDPNPARHKRFKEDVLSSLSTKLQGTPDEILEEALLRFRDRLITAEEAINHAELKQEEGREALQFLINQGRVLTFTAENKTFAVATEILNEWKEAVTKLMQEYQTQYPLRPGLPKEEVRSRYFSGINNKLFTFVMQFMEEQELLTIRGQAITTRDWVPMVPSEVSKPLAEAVQLFKEGWWQPPGWDDTAEKTALPLKWREEALHYLLHQGTLVKLSDEVQMHGEALQAAKKVILEQLAVKQPLSLAEVRDLLGSTRKYILPLLEYLDQTKVTRRQGDARVKF